MTRAVDWTDCDMIEQIPGKVSGRPVVRGTRILPDAIVNSFDMGESLQDLRQGFPSLSDTEIVKLRAAEASGVNVFLTGDQTLPFEKNLHGRKLAVVVLSSVEFPILREKIPLILAAIDRAVAVGCETVDCGCFNDKPAFN